MLSPSAITVELLRPFADLIRRRRIAVRSRLVARIAQNRTGLAGIASCGNGGREAETADNQIRDIAGRIKYFAKLASVEAATPKRIRKRQSKVNAMGCIHKDAPVIALRLIKDVNGPNIAHRYIQESNVSFPRRHRLLNYQPSIGGNRKNGARGNRQSRREKCRYYQ